MTSNIDYLSNANAIKKSNVERIQARMAEEMEMVAELPLANIDPNPYQPRVDFSAVEEMASSLRERGQYYPIIVRRKDDGRYEVADGETRLRAAKLNLERDPRRAPESIKAVVRKFTDVDMALSTFITAYQRSELKPLEEAHGLQRLHAEFGLEYKVIAQHLGKPEHYVWERIRLLRLPEPVRAMVAEEKLTAGHAIALATYKGPEDKLEEMAKKVVARDLTVHQTRELARKDTAETTEPVEVVVTSEGVSEVTQTKTDPWKELQGVWKRLGSEQRVELLDLARAMATKPVVVTKPPKKPRDSKVVALGSKRSRPR